MIDDFDGEVAWNYLINGRLVFLLELPVNIWLR